MNTRSRSLGLALLSSSAFIALGLPDGLLGVTWPSMRTYFGVTLDGLGPLLVAFTGGYVVSSLFAGRMLARLGLGRLLALSCGVTCASFAGYATTGSWNVVIALAFMAGLGAGGMDTGINTHAATHYGPRMLNWLHGCYGIGATTGPVLMTAVLVEDAPWQRGYAVVAGALFPLACVFAATSGAWPAPRDHAAGRGEERVRTMRATLRLPVARWSILLFLAYAGLELAVGSWAFTLLAEGRGVSKMSAGSSVSLYWAGLAIGRMLGAIMSNRLHGNALVGGCLVALTAGLVLVAAGNSQGFDSAGLIVAGTAAGPVFPTLLATTPARVGAAHVGNAVGFQVAAAAVGQSLVPATLGVVGERLGLGALAAGLVLLGALTATLFVTVSRCGHAPGGVAAHPSLGFHVKLLIWDRNA